jgi:hypothetical protein
VLVCAVVPRDALTKKSHSREPLVPFSYRTRATSRGILFRASIRSGTPSQVVVTGLWKSLLEPSPTAPRVTLSKKKEPQTSTIAETTAPTVPSPRRDDVTHASVEGLPQFVPPTRFSIEDHGRKT